MDRGAWCRLQSIGSQSRTQLSDFTFTFPIQGTSWASLVAQAIKNLLSMQETRVGFLGEEDPLEEGMAPTPVFQRIAWRIPWTEEPGRLQSLLSEATERPTFFHFTGPVGPRPQSFTHILQAGKEPGILRGEGFRKRSLYDLCRRDSSFPCLLLGKSDTPFAY